jgi:uncharacterized protein YjbI with pentapeptide repeats
MKKNSKLSIVSAIVSLGLLLGSATPATSAEPCTFPYGGIGVDASGCNFEGRDLFNADFTGSNFSNTNLTDVFSRYSYWSEVNFSDANLTDSTFYGANFADSDFTGANLSGANIAASNVAGTDFSQATLTGLISGGLTGTPILPAGWISSGGYLIGPGANLSGANLSGVDLTGADLSGANLNGVRSGGILGNPTALPTNYGLYGGYLIGPGADLSGAKLDGLAIWGSNLTNVNLAGASINQTALNNTTSFEGVRSGGLVGSIQSINGAKLVDGYIVSAKANLAGASLRGADLSNLSLQDINLTGADLTGANLTGTYLVGATVVNTNFTFANLTGTIFWGNSISFSNFNGANLTNAGFEDTQILASEFYQTEITDTNFSRASLLSTRSGDVSGVPAALPNDIQIIDGEITRVFTQSLSPVVEGVGQTGQTVEAGLQATPDGATVSFQWLRNGEPIQGANTRTYLVTAKDVNNSLTVRTTLSKRSIQTKVETSAPFSIVKANIVPGTVNISGVMKAGKVIRAIVRPWVNTVGVKFKYQWYRNGVAIKYATKSTYKLLPADSKQNISVIVSQSLDGYNSASKQSPKRKVS